MFQKLYQNRRSYFMSDFSHFHYFFWKACYWHKLLKLIVGWNQVFSLTWEFFERFLSEIVAVWMFQNLYQNGRSYFLSNISQFYLFFFWNTCYWQKPVKLIVGWNQVFDLTLKFFERFLSEIVAIWMFQNPYQNGRSYFMSDFFPFS